MIYILLLIPVLVSLASAFLLLGRPLSDERISHIVLGNIVSKDQKGKRSSGQSERLLQLYGYLKEKNQDSSNSITALLMKAGVRGPNAVEAYRVSRLLFSLGFGVAVFLFLMLSDREISLLIQTLLVLSAGGTGFFLPTLLMINKAQKRRDEIKVGLPDMLDLMVICLQGGLGLEPSLTRVSNEIRRSHRVLSEEIMALNVELAYLGDRFKAYQNLQDRVDLPEIKSLVSMMYQSERLGTPLGVAFDTLAAETRAERMSLVERKAGALSSKLTVPMIVFFVPAMFVVIMGPPILQMISG
jgi:tight adherence protein C